MRERPGRFHGVAHDAIGWLVLSGSIVVVYTGLVAGLGRLVGGDGPTWLLVAATGAIAIAIEPARDRIRGAVDRLVWGARDDPLEVVHSVVDHVGAEAGDDLLPALVEILQRELRLEAVAIDVRTADGWRRAASLGPATPHQRSIELEQRGQVVGRLVVGWQDGPSLRHRDERILAELAGPLGLAVGWARLAEDLRRSSVAIVSAREEERRRLRRDLHDGLGPALTGVSLGLRTAVRQLERGPQADTLRPSRQLLGALGRRGRRARRRGQAHRARPAPDGARPARPRRRRGRVRPHVRRRPRDPPVDAGRAGRAAGRRRGGDLPHRHRSRHQRRAPRPGGALLADDLGRAGGRHRRRRRRHRRRRRRGDGRRLDGDARAGRRARRLGPRRAERAHAAPGSTCASRRCCRDRWRARRADRCGWRSSTTTRCSAWDWPRRSTRWTASSSSGEAQRADQVAALVADAAPDVLLLDVRLDDASGLEVNRWLGRAPPGGAGHHADDVGGPRHRADGAARRRRRLPRQGRRPGAGRAGAADGRRRRRRARPGARRRRDRAGPGPPGPDRPARSRSSPTASSTSSLLVAQGLDNTSIARRLVLSPKTVRNHVSNVFAKIQAPDRPGAIVLAHRAGLGS